MTKTAIAFLGLMIIASGAFAQPEAVISGKYFDFGLMPQDAVVCNYFWVRSIGTDTVKITGVKTGCACVAIPLEQDWIAPGDSLAVGVYWDTEKSTGKVGRYPYIFTNAAPDPLQVNMTGLVVIASDTTRPVTIIPNRWELSRYRQLAIDSLNFKLINHSDQTVAITRVSFPVEECEILMPDTIKAKATVSGYIKVRPEYIDKEFKGSITIMVDDGPKTRLTIPIRRKLY